MTALDPASRQTWTNLITGRHELFYARSACGRWHYERTEEDTTPWIVTYEPTGQEQRFGTIAAARRWTASPQALPDLRRQALDVLEAGCRVQVRFPLNDFGRPYRLETHEPEAECAPRLERARRHLAILDQQLRHVAA